MALLRLLMIHIISAEMRVELTTGRLSFPILIGEFSLVSPQQNSENNLVLPVIRKKQKSNQ